MAIDDLTEFEKLEIQMQYVVPLVRDLQRIVGEETIERALERRLEEAVETSRERASDAAAVDLGETGVAMMERYGEGIPFEMDVLTRDRDRFDVNVTRCGYAEMMERVGGREIGHLLICQHDFAMAERLGLELTRTQTCMQGATHCDFRYRKRAASRGQEG